MLSVLALLVPGFWAQQGDAAALTATEILDRVARTHAACKAYRDAGVVRTTRMPAELVGVVDPRKHQDARILSETKAFRTSFVAPDRLRFECWESAQDSVSRYILWVDASDVRTWWGLDPPGWPDIRPGEEHPDSLGDAFVRATVVSSGVARDTLGLLMPLRTPGAAFMQAAEAERLPDVQLDDVPCFSLKGKFWNTDVTVWIDQGTFLVRRAQRIVASDTHHIEIVATYEPEIDVEIGAGELAFDPPRSKSPATPMEEPVRTPLPHEAEFDPRFEHALELVGAGAYDAALREFEWLWDATNNLESAFEPDIRPDVIEAIGRLAELHPAARTHFGAIFDDLDAKVRADAKPVYRFWMDWADLGRALELDDRIVQLYVERRSPTGSLRFGDFHSYALDELFDILIERKQYADAGRIHADPVKKAETVYDISIDYGRREGSRLHALTLAAGRTGEAAAIAHLILTKDDSIEARCDLAIACLQFDVRCEGIATWLAEIRERGGDVGDLEALLSKPAGAGSQDR